MARFAASIELAQQSWRALQQNRQLIAFPIISMIGMLIATALFFVPLAVIGGPVLASDGQMTPAQTVAALVTLFIYYLVVYTIVIFSNTALVGATMRLARGQSGTVGDGIQIALARLPQIVAF